MPEHQPTRRAFLGLAAGAAAALPFASDALRSAASASTKPTSSPGASPVPSAVGRPNILLFITDQERSDVVLPSGFTLPARARLAADGVRFAMHHTPTAPCSPARSTLFTGLHVPVNGVLDNVGQNQHDLAPSIPTLGTILQSAGYRTCYIGKWHLSANITTDPACLAPYGFDESIDLLGGGFPNEGSTQDPGVAGHAQEWITAHAEDTQPWLLVVSLVNPHDMMFCPRFYRLDDVPDYGAAAPANFESDLSSKPAVQTVWRAENEVVGGLMPNGVDSDRDRTQWRQWGNWYLELLRRTDVLLGDVLDTLQGAGRSQDTVVVQVADHGEVGGSHGLRQKGAMIYKENLRVPLVIADPRAPATRGCTSDALVSHIDVVPTLAAMAGVNATSFGPLVGHDLHPMLADPRARVREALLVTSDATSSGLGIPGLQYFIRGTITGQHSFGRYSTPDGLDGAPDSFTYECYDRRNDPGEVHNLGTKGAHDAVIRDLSALTNELIAAELQAIM